MKQRIIPSTESGWDVISADSSGQGQAAENIESIGEIELSEASLALPLSTIYLHPMRVSSEDELVIQGAVQLALELAGVIEDENCGWGFYKIDSEHVVGVAILDDSLVEEGLDAVAELDVFARFSQQGEEDFIACWREQGQTALGFYKNGKLLYAEMLNENMGTQNVIEVIQTELGRRNISFAPTRHIFWLAEKNIHEEEYLRDVELYFPKFTIEAVPAPDLVSGLKGPFVPKEKYVKSEKSKKQNRIKTLVLCALAAYAILVCFFLYQFFSLKQEVSEMQELAAVSQPESEKIQQEQARLEELSDLMRGERWALGTFKAIVSKIPSNQTLKIQEIEIQPEKVSLRGGTPKLEVINSLFPALQKEPYFSSEYEWTKTPPRRDPKTGLWNFKMEAERTW